MIGCGEALQAALGVALMLGLFGMFVLAIRL